MITIKSAREIKLMKKSAEILVIAKQAVYDAIKPGITTNALDVIANEVITKMGAKAAFLGYGGFPKTACISVNEELIHGIPSERVLKDGDVVSVDMGAI